MGAGLNVTSALLCVGTVLFIVLAIATTRSNQTTVTVSQSNPFYGFYGAAPGAHSLTKKTSAGETVPAISCPDGYEVQIITAVCEVYDPYQQCNPGVTVTGGGSGGTKVWTTPLGSVTGTCKDNPQAAPCQNTRTSPGTSGGTCGDPPGFNTVCQYAVGGACPGTGHCVMRDASAYLAAKCDGTQACTVSIEPSFFGPYPCNFGPSTSAPYTSLPASSGTQSTPPVLSGGTGSTGSSTNQGYVVHGLFACVPKAS